MSNEGVLYVVATPIGNLEDITLRALRILKEADVILAEDTRVTKKLLSRYEIKTRVERFDAHTEAKIYKSDMYTALFDRIRAGEKIALVSDAGTPAISDPGARLVGAARAAGARVEAIPGPSSVIAALSVAGMKNEEFMFLGFLPHKKGRQTALSFVAGSLVPVVLFESTHRITRLLKELAVCAPARRITLARELTKIHEEVLTGTSAELLETLATHPQKQRGEFVVIVA